MSEFQTISRVYQRTKTSPSSEELAMSPRNLHRLLLATAAPAVLLLFLSACDDPTQPSSRPPVLAAAVVTNERTQWIDIAPRLCNGEAIPITGTIHEVISLTETGTGVLKQVMHFRLFAKGTSPTTGEMFIVNHVGVIVFPDVRDLSEGTGEIIAKLIGQSSGVIELFRVKYHLIYDAAGRVTAYFDEFEIVCL
jgi:hypothetical protein